MDLRTRVVVLMHRREWSKTTATAHLGALALSNYAILLRGNRDEPIAPADVLSSERRPLLLFPSDDARTLTPALLAEDARPVTLIVPDGSWRQASKVAKRTPFLHDVERVILPAGPPSRYRLRREPRQEGLATFEAIARSLGIIEGQNVRTNLEQPFLAMVEGTLETRRGLH